GESNVLPAPGLLDALQVDPQPRLLPESRVDRFGKREGMASLTGEITQLNSGGLLDFLGARIVCCFGFLGTGRASRRRLLGHLLGRGEFLTNVEVHRGKNSLCEAFRVATALVAAPEWAGQQEESEKLQPDSESPGYDRLGRQSQILVHSR